MDIVDFGQIIGKLKKIKRSGWVKNHVPDPESVADHCFRVIVLAMFLAKRAGVDQEKVIKMAIVHDLAESMTGDIIVVEGNKVVSDPDLKIRNEKEALRQLLAMIDATEYTQLLDEYEDNETPEAKFLKQIDKLEMALQAYEYEKETGLDLETFFVTSRMVVTEPPLKEILEEIESLRKL